MPVRGSEPLGRRYHATVRGEYGTGRREVVTRSHDERARYYLSSRERGERKSHGPCGKITLSPYVLLSYGYGRCVGNFCVVSSTRSFRGNAREITFLGGKEIWRWYWNVPEWSVSDFEWSFGWILNETHMSWSRYLEILNDTLRIEEFATLTSVS